MSEFGPLIDYARVENAIVDEVIRPWIDSYLIAVERENGLRPRLITRPRSWRVLDDLSTTPEKNLPVFYVISAGDIETPADDGDGSLSGLIALGVVIACKDTDRDTTRITTRRYAAAVAALLEHKLGVAGVGIKLASRPRQAFDERLNVSTQRPFAMGVAYVTFDAQVGAIRYRGPGPDKPFPPPPPDGPADPGPNPTDPDHISTNVTATPE